jgi:hypothetical protein
LGGYIALPSYPCHGVALSVQVTNACILRFCYIVSARLWRVIKQLRCDNSIFNLLEKYFSFLWFFQQCPDGKVFDQTVDKCKETSSIIYCGGK